MIVELPGVKQSARVAVLTGGAHLPGREPGEPSRRVSVEDFEAHRAAVESVSVLFRLFEPGADGELVEVPSGWSVTGAKFEVEWPGDRERQELVRSHFGARRYAFNWALGRVKTDLEARRQDPEHEGVAWSLAALRKEWNQVKDEVAPVGGQLEGVLLGRDRRPRKRPLELGLVEDGAAQGAARRVPEVQGAPP